MKLILLIIAFGTFLLAVNGGTGRKVAPALENALKAKRTVNILVSMKEDTKNVLEQISKLKFNSRTDRSQAVYNSLTELARSSQTKVLSKLNLVNTETKIAIKSLWITNQIAVLGASNELVNQLAGIEEISLIEEEEIIHLDPMETSTTLVTPKSTNWGIDKIQVPAVWSITGGNNGTGITIGNIDSGVRYTHEALNHNYKNDSFSWFDPYQYTHYPNDQGGHGTHVMGTIVGSGGLGVAPGAEWIACKGLEVNYGTNIALIQCAQFMICPHDPYDMQVDCSKTPHAVCNSWGGSGGNGWFSSLITAWHMAGIVPVFANGNSGPGCSSSGSPGDYPDLISVGATTENDYLATFSSVGPSQFGVIKPDISAPGYNIISASHRSNTGLALMNGTSMACPHVTGLIALMLSKNPTLSYNEIKSLLQSNTDQNLSFQGSNCDGIPDNVFPNNHFGYGRINALKAVQAVPDRSSGLSSKIYGSSTLFLILCIKIVFLIN